MRFFVALLLSLGGVTSVAAGQVQKSNLRLPSTAPAGRAAVKKIFLDSYNAYLKFALPHDSLLPLSASFEDDRNGWGASVVDAMSTLKIMGFDDLFNDAVRFASKIDFSKSQTPDTVSVFETTIRYLGGLLSAFELSGKRFPILVEKAREVADKMAFAWVNDNDVPFGFLNFTTNSPTIATSNIAEAGTLALEWATLSKYTGNNTYRELAEKSLRHIANLPAPLPGLAAQGIDPASGQFVGSYITWGGGSDSYFEYLIKFSRLFNLKDTLLANTWKTAVDSSIKNLLRTDLSGQFFYLADRDDSKNIRHIGSHLACFYGGNWLLGGKLLDNQTIVDLGLKLTDACWNTYESTATGIGPEAFAYTSKDGNFTGNTPPNATDLAFNAEHGFYVDNGAPFYILRPEVLESNFYAWRVTGDRKYVDRASSAVNSFNRFLKAGVAFSGITDVRIRNGDRFDIMPSFFFAEVLKYLFLTFDDPEHISLDNFVFNTEAHPFMAPPTRRTFNDNSPPIPEKAGFRTVPGQLPEVSPVPKVPSISDVQQRNGR